MITEDEISLVDQDSLLEMSSISDLEIRRLKEQLNELPDNMAFPQEDEFEMQFKQLQDQMADNERLRFKMTVGQLGIQEEDKEKEEKSEDKYGSSVSGLENSLALDVPHGSGLSHLNSVVTDSNLQSALSSQLHGQGMDSNMSKTVAREKRPPLKKKPVPQNTLVKQILQQHSKKQAQIDKRDQDMQLLEEVDKKQVKKKVAKVIRVEPTLDFRITKMQDNLKKVSKVNYPKKVSVPPESVKSTRSEKSVQSAKEELFREEQVDQGDQGVRGMPSEERAKRDKVNKLLEIKRQKQKQQEEKELAQFKLLKQKQAFLAQEKKDQELKKNLILKKGSRDERKLEKKVNLDEAGKRQEHQEQEKSAYLKLREQLRTVKQQNVSLNRTLTETQKQRRETEEHVKEMVKSEKIVEVEPNVFVLAETGQIEVAREVMQGVAGEEMAAQEVVAKVVARIDEMQLTLEEVFSRLDSNGDQLLSKEEIKSNLHLVVDLSGEEQGVLLALVDTNQDDLVSLEEFSQCIQAPLRQQQFWKEALQGVSQTDPLSLRQAILHFQVSQPYLQHRDLDTQPTQSALSTLAALQHHKQEEQAALQEKHSLSTQALTSQLDTQQQCLQDKLAEAQDLKEQLVAAKKDALIEPGLLDTLKGLHAQLLRQEEAFIQAQHVYHTLQRKVDMQGDLQNEMAPVISQILKYRASLYNHDNLALYLSATKIQSMYRRKKAEETKKVHFIQYTKKIRIIQKQCKLFLELARKRRKQKAGFKKVGMIIRNVVLKREYNLFIRKLREYVILNRNQMTLQFQSQEEIMRQPNDSVVQKPLQEDVNQRIRTLDYSEDDESCFINTFNSNNKIPDSFLKKACDMCKIRDIQVICQDCTEHQELCETCFREVHKIKKKKNHRLHYLKSQMPVDAEKSLASLRAQLDPETLQLLSSSLDILDKKLVGVLEEYEFKNVLLSIESLAEREGLVQDILDYCRAFCLGNNAALLKRHPELTTLSLKYIDYLKFVSLF